MIAAPARPLPAVLALLGMFLFAAPASAQDEPDQPMPAPPTDPSGSPAPAPAPAQPVPPPPPGYAPAYPPPGAVVALSDRDLKRFLDADPSYRSGKRRRLAGILTTTIGGGLTIAMAATFGFVYSICDSVRYDGSSDSSCGELRNIAIGFLVGFGASLAIGIPLWASGQSQMNEVRRTRFQEVVPMHRPRVLLDLGRDRAGLGLAWRFQ